MGDMKIFSRDRRFATVHFKKYYHNKNLLF